ncbi:MAG: sensor histidine kinase [Bacteroidota bacterium]|nr:sensor histidine kinase [Bacteroidota bacterium]
MNLKNKVASITNFGVDSLQPLIDKRRIKTLNILNLIVIAGLVLGATNSLVLKSNYPIWAELIFLGLALSSLILNKYKKQTFSFLVFTFNVNLSVFFVSKYYPSDVGNYLYYFPLIVSVVLLNNPAKFDKYTATHLVICIVSFLFNLFIEIPTLRNNNFTQDEIKLIWYYNIIFSVLCTTFLSMLLTKLIHDQNKEVLFSYYEQKKSQQELTTTLNQKEVLLAELHHRVKNNLAIVSGLLNLQEGATDNSEAKSILNESKNRIMSMALVHRMLYQNSDFKTINIKKYTNSLLLEILNSYNLYEKVGINSEYDDVELTTTELIPYGLILNEIITNCVKYAFIDHPSPNLNLSVKRNINAVKLIVGDNGTGFSKDFNAESNGNSIGISLIKTLSNQLDGEATFYNDNGAKVEINFQYG